MKSWLPEIDFQINGALSNLMEIKLETDLKITCNPSIQELKDEAVRTIRENIEFKPLILFGCDDMAVRLAKEFPEAKVLVAAKEKDLPTVVPQCKEQKAQVISVLANEFEVGLNLSF